MGYVKVFGLFIEVYVTNKIFYRVIRFFFGKEVYYRQGNDGIDIKEQVDIYISDEGYFCFVEEVSQQVYLRKCCIVVG